MPAYKVLWQVVNNLLRQKRPSRYFDEPLHTTLLSGWLTPCSIIQIVHCGLLRVRLDRDALYLHYHQLARAPVLPLIESAGLNVNRAKFRTRHKRSPHLIFQTEVNLSYLKYKKSATDAYFYSIGGPGENRPGIRGTPRAVTFLVI